MSVSVDHQQPRSATLSPQSTTRHDPYSTPVLVAETAYDGSGVVVDDGDGAADASTSSVATGYLTTPTAMDMLPPPQDHPHPYHRYPHEYQEGDVSGAEAGEHYGSHGCSSYASASVYDPNGSGCSASGIPFFAGYGGGTSPCDPCLGGVDHTATTYYGYGQSDLSSFCPPPPAHTNRGGGHASNTPNCSMTSIDTQSSQQTERSDFVATSADEHPLAAQLYGPPRAPGSSTQSTPVMCPSRTNHNQSSSTTSFNSAPFALSKRGIQFREDLRGGSAYFNDVAEDGQLSTAAIGLPPWSFSGFLRVRIPDEGKCDFVMGTNDECVMSVRIGDRVVVPSDRGVELAVVVESNVSPHSATVALTSRNSRGPTTTPFSTNSSSSSRRPPSHPRQQQQEQPLSTFREVVAVATEEDIHFNDVELVQEAAAIEPQVRAHFEKFAQEKKTGGKQRIHFEGCRFQFDKSRLIVYYSLSGPRVYFVGLLRTLHQRYSCRIWMVRVPAGTGTMNRSQDATTLPVPVPVHAATSSSVSSDSLSPASSVATQAGKISPPAGKDEVESLPSEATEGVTSSETSSNHSNALKAIEV